MRFELLCPGVEGPHIVRADAVVAVIVKPAAVAYSSTIEIIGSRPRGRSRSR
ncbi:hypothetical protein I553_2052 [Mycobacterium xenopi 4042]|uniref:Uncharacterized protein n=1 Tax=Mycobacterium xenopi 4042 TaxID=1299334 RepID=X8DKG6_MYCXE|nr:hypothetical protein I553_2052 [Mycobacterium xenopi 4042]